MSSNDFTMVEEVAIQWIVRIYPGFDLAYNRLQELWHATSYCIGIPRVNMNLSDCQRPWKLWYARPSRDCMHARHNYKRGDKRCFLILVLYLYCILSGNIAVKVYSFSYNLVSKKFKGLRCFRRGPFLNFELEIPGKVPPPPFSTSLVMWIIEKKKQY
jgi:hypothetical protein